MRGSVVSEPEIGVRRNIDAHAHVWTLEKARYPWDPNYAGPVYKPASFTPDQLLTSTRAAGVGRVVLVQMSFYGYDNSYMLDVLKRHPSVHSGIAVVDASAPGVRDEMIRLKRRGVRGFRIAPGKDPRGWLETPGMAAMWKCGAERRLAMCGLIGPDAIPSVDRMCAKFPETPVVIDHLARIGADGCARDIDVSALCGLARHRNAHVKVSAFYALGKKRYPYTDLSGIIHRVFDSFGPQRLMWASDSPFQTLPPHTYEGSIELVRDRLEFLTMPDREWLLFKTAERLFFQPA
ncbi:MAG: amidohydrolase family protein [Acidobacteriota bacterium]|nr:amidohydrolase family protein [Acidobacteriota bacterium]